MTRAWIISCAACSVRKSCHNLKITIQFNKFPFVFIIAFPSYFTTGFIRAPDIIVTLCKSEQCFLLLVVNVTHTVSVCLNIITNLIRCFWSEFFTF